MGFSKIGLVPDAGCTRLIGNSAGRIKALGMALLGERMNVADAHSAGLVTRVVENEALASTA
jgi:2-(1,2-epoxy-1,2-dihydrophenyl)acetyl-CoA isomerase